MHHRSNLPATIAALLAAAPTLAGTLQPEAVPVPGAATGQPGVVMSASEADKHAILSSQQAKLNDVWETTGYRVLLRSGDRLPLLLANGQISADKTASWGGIVDTLGHPVVDGGTPRISNDSDFNSLIQGADGKLYLISHFETRPGAIYQTLLDQQPDGTLVPRATRPIDFSAYQGGWVHCAGSVSPWGTHIGSEEYEPDARMWSTEAGGNRCEGTDPTKQRPSDYESAMVKYLVDGSQAQYEPTCANATAHMNPYRYGWPIEVKVGTDGIATAQKLFAMGRSANELSYVMPDRKTVYITEDGTNTMLLMFLADTAGDLSAGTLYAAKWTQLDGNESNGGRGSLGWVSLGHANAAEVAAALDGQTFDKLLEVGTVTETGCADPAFVSIDAGHGSAKHECLKARGAVADNVLSRLETRRFAAMRGATAEFRKMEGFTFNPEQKVAYLAISEIDKGMENDKGADAGGPNDIRLARNLCGAVYELQMTGSVKDNAGAAIPSDYVAVEMSGLIAGLPVADSADKDTAGKTTNTCALNGIANPDNLTYLPGYDTLIIGEDTGTGHQNDFIWSYGLRTRSLSRVLAAPYGAETTSPYWYQDVGGHGYLMAVIQHPYGESDTGAAASAPEGAESAKRAYTGYFKFPELK
jgi:uncharacterized protein